MTAVVEREREVPAHPTPSGSVVSSVTSRTTNSTNDSTGSKLSGDEAGSAAVRRQEGVGAGVMTADRTSSSSAYRDLDAVIEDIRKELELNKAEEVKTLIIKEQVCLEFIACVGCGLCERMTAL